ncbi:MAG: chloride channel protein, partial [Ruminococcaceae bacterium]|nr:chloride channel protein [Oscillospiraceae bacterium]
MQVWKKAFFIQKEEPPLKLIDNLKKTIGDAFRYLAAFAKWTLISLFIGFLGGGVGSLFHISIDAATEYRNGHTWLIFLLPAGGVIIALLYRLCRRFGKLGTDRVLEALKTENNLPAIMAPLIFASTVITHFFGGSAGREGAALQLGGSMGYTVGKLIRLNSSDRHIIVMTGMSAVFAALFGTPLTAAIFAIEVTFVGMSCYAALLPCTISAICGAKVATEFGISPVAFFSDVSYEITPALLARSAVLAFLCAIISIIFCYTVRYFSKASKKLIPNPYARAAVGGALIALLTISVGCYDYNGAGMGIISEALNGSCVPYAFALKLVFTALTIAAGFKGGEIVP